MEPICTVFAVCAFAVLIVFARFAIGLFTRDQELVAVAVPALRVIAVAFPVVGLQMMGAVMFQAFGRAGPALFLSLSRQMILLIPLVLVMQEWEADENLDLPRGASGVECTMKVAIASGKGGTGKTTVAVNLALVAGQLQVLDCDVEDPDAAIFLQPQVSSLAPVFVQVPRVLPAKCTYCGECARFCEYNAIVVLPDQWLLTPELCKDCRGCYIVCPEEALWVDVPYLLR